MEKITYLSIKAIFFGFGIITIYQIIPYFTKLLNLLINLMKLSNTSNEFKIILVCLSIWVTCSIINTIVNIIFKLQKMIKYTDFETNIQGDKK